MLGAAPPCFHYASRDEREVPVLWAQAGTDEEVEQEDRRVQGAVQAGADGTGILNRNGV